MDNSDTVWSFYKYPPPDSGSCCDSLRMERAQLLIQLTAVEKKNLSDMAAYQFPLRTGVMSASGGGSVTLNRRRVIFLTFSVIETVLLVLRACLLIPPVRC